MFCYCLSYPKQTPVNNSNQTNILFFLKVIFSPIRCQWGFVFHFLLWWRKYHGNTFFFLEHLFQCESHVETFTSLFSGRISLDTMGNLARCGWTMMWFYQIANIYEKGICLSVILWKRARTVYGEKRFQVMSKCCDQTWTEDERKMAVGGGVVSWVVKTLDSESRCAGCDSCLGW